MARKPFTIASFGYRVLFALVLVFATYNPLEYSYYHWAIRPLLADPGDFTILKALVGVALIIGTILLTLLFGLFLWWMIDNGWISLDEPGTMSWLILVVLIAVLAVGISWSHIRRRLTGQVDVEEADQ